ncbi:MAG TPA: hypothetical protein VED40_16750 [Azospirillaceae bacterium]|nr:hypothetical protein [Azospirillaceae bacterium]
MAEDKFHRTGGTADPQQNPPATEAPPGANPDRTRAGNQAGQVSQEGGTTAKPEPKTDSGSPGRQGQ